ncbi:hypothetical protein RJ639_001542 [Escallonia herrerae]|uniref:LysM domain-containing protein n=1 Tax=Escallonia herrerae TaxID=1293975 RepID=A0AA88XH15_9ASTE|nr:hypothetical protein RJ639_001542 [Escallonia herrerae]
MPSTIATKAVPDDAEEALDAVLSALRAPWPDLSATSCFQACPFRWVANHLVVMNRVEPGRSGVDGGSRFAVTRRCFSSSAANGISPSEASQWINSQYFGLHSCVCFINSHMKVKNFLFLTHGQHVLATSQANFIYIVPNSTTFADIACGVYEGLVKSVTLVGENQWQGNHLTVGSMLHLPLKCACPDNFSVSVGVKYLVTYPIVEFDYTEMISKKFGIPPEDIWAANNLEPGPTVYPNTTVLVPLKKEPSINALKKNEAEHIPSFVRSSSCSTPRSSPISGPTTSTNSCLSPDLLAGLKYTLCNYSTEEIRRATRNFSEDSKMSGDLYKGLLDDVEVMIKQMKFDDTRQVIDLHSKINHGMIVKLLGVCYGENELCCSYLVFEFPNGGCLRECLSHSSYSLRWHRRTQIAFDIATGLH